MKLTVCDIACYHYDGYSLVELLGLAPVRSSRQDQIHASIVSTLLALMDGLDHRGEISILYRLVYMTTEQAGCGRLPQQGGEAKSW